MRNIPKQVDSVQQEHRKALMLTYSALLFAFFCMGIISFFAYRTIKTMTHISSELTNSAVSIKQEITAANLLFIEIFHKTSSRDLNDVWKIMESSKKRADLLANVEGGLGINAEIDAFRKIMLECYKERENEEGAGARSQQYRKNYTLLIERLDGVEEGLKALTASKMVVFQRLYIALFANVAFLFAFLVYAFHKYSGQRRLAERNLSYAKNSLNTILNSIDSIVVSVDKDKSVTMWNEAARKYTKIPLEQAFARNVLDLLPLLQDYRAVIDKVYHSHNPVELYRERVMVDNKQRVYDMSFNYTQGLDNVVITVEDMTAQEVKDEQLRQSQKLNVVSNLISGLAHSFNNAIGAITGTISMMKFSLKDKGSSAADVRESIEVIESSAEKAEVMVQQLLSLTADEPPEKRPVDLNFIVRHLMKICENTIDKSIELDAELYSVKALVMADPRQMEQILLGLCDNAAYAMTNLPPHRADEVMTLTVAVDHVCPDSEYKRKQPLATAGAYWTVSVTDTGIGMDNETVSKIFDPFFTTREHATGLGLAVIHDMVERHDGYIEVKSKIDLGTIVTVYLPEYTGDAGESPDEIEPDYSEQIPLGEGLVMVVDDEEVMRTTASNILKKLGYDTVTAKDGEEAVGIFKEKHDEIALTLLDLSMPKLSGKEAYEEMRKIDSSLKVLIVSGLASEDRINEVISLGANGFIKKPYGMIELARDVKTAITGR
ncbi:MAG: response regulator [Victivallales bacterium]|nr:response regulator [Victivallales bacterium]